MQPLIEYLSSGAGDLSPKTITAASGTITRMDELLIAGLRYLARDAPGDRAKADTCFDDVLETESRSSRYPSQFWVRPSNEKCVYTLHEEISRRVFARTGMTIVFKEYYLPSKRAGRDTESDTSVHDAPVYDTATVQWIGRYWTALAASQSERLLPGEIVAVTERRMLSLLFLGGNLCYDIPVARDAASRDIEDGIVRRLLTHNAAFIEFSSKFIEQNGHTTTAERYAEKLLDSVNRLSETHRLASLRSAYQKEDISSKLLLGASVPFTDMKSGNLVFEKDASPATFLSTGKGLRLIDADKMMRRITAAHSYAHILADPRWALSLDEQLKRYSDIGLLRPADEESTVLGLWYYLVRQADLSSSESTAPYARWRDIDGSRHDAFIEQLRMLSRHDVASRHPAIKACAGLSRTSE
ncbi:TPA: hypothetical protein HA251_02685 [Candidatus Woesearchaeota archaeon]|nr:hypothetical protein [Candidatus Woesearchaeota archaeon]